MRRLKFDLGNFHALFTLAVRLKSFTLYKCFMFLFCIEVHSPILLLFNMVVVFAVVTIALTLTCESVFYNKNILRKHHP